MAIRLALVSWFRSSPYRRYRARANFGIARTLDSGFPPSPARKGSRSPAIYVSFREYGLGKRVLFVLPAAGTAPMAALSHSHIAMPPAMDPEFAMPARIAPAVRPAIPGSPEPYGSFVIGVIAIIFIGDAGIVVYDNTAIWSWAVIGRRRLVDACAQRRCCSGGKKDR